MVSQDHKEHGADDKTDNEPGTALWQLALMRLQGGRIPNADTYIERFERNSFCDDSTSGRC
jgi:hypothetical protein